MKLYYTSRKFFVIAAFLLPVAGIAQELDGDRPEKTVAASRTSHAPSIDGVLDEPAWAGATVIDDLHQVNPVEFAEPSEKTEILLMFDDDALYVGLRAFDSEPGKIVARVLRQGEGLRGEDRIRVVVNPFNDYRSGYFFMLNPNSVRLEGIYKDNVFDRDWSGIWQGAARVDDTGWTAEMEIPFKTLSFNADQDWGFNVARDIVRKGEEMAWNSRNRATNPSSVGTLTGLSGLSQGMGLDIVPSVSATERRMHVDGTSSSDVDPSLDIFYKVTPGMNASLTFNTDFSATEVDNRQVNLTRFNLFFPEKRAFFLREADIFEFGGIGGDNNNETFSEADRENGRPYFSRRIGLSGTGEPVDLKVGAKLSGRAGRWNIGLQAIRQAPFEDVAATDIIVARLLRNVLAESSVGFIVTDGDPRSNNSNTVAGLDFQYRNSRLSGGRRIDAGVFYQKSDTTGRDGDSASYGVMIDMPNQEGWRGGAAFRAIEQDFFPAVGFISRPGIEQISGDFGYTYRHNGRIIRKVFAGVDAQRIDRIDGGLQSQSIVFKALELQSNAEDELQFSYRQDKENLLNPFEISEGIIIPPGTYSFGAPEIKVETAKFRIVSGEIVYKDGDFFSGTIRSVEAEMQWRPSKHFRLTAGFRTDEVKLPQGRFTTRLGSTQFDIVFSNTISWVNLVQYDNVSNTIGLNSRLHWAPEAGRNVYLVLNRNYLEETAGSSFSAVSTDITIKADYTFRF